MYVYSHKYNPFSQIIWHWRDNWYALPGKAISPISSFPQLPILLCLGSRPPGLSPHILA